MEMNSSKCRLCLSQSTSCLNIFVKKINDKSIASILTQHFWFDVKEDDPNKDICQDCWITVQDFHLLYAKVYIIHHPLPEIDKYIKLETNETELSGNIDVFADLAPKLAIKTENITENQNKSAIGDNQYTLQSDVDQDNLSSCSFKEENILNDSDETNSDQIIPSPPNRKTRKRKPKRVKLSQTKKISDPVKQAKIDQQNKQISEYFSMDCELCLVKFDTFRKLQYHYRMEHKIKGYVRCCTRKFVKRVYLLEHLRRHLNPETFRCETCNKNFAAKRCLQLHLRSHLPLEERPYKCTECPKTYVIANLFKHHLQTHATERKFECEKCDKSYVSEFQLKSHQRSMHSDGNIHICNVCSKPFRSKYAFEQHHKNMHGNALRKVQCKICFSWVKHKYYLKQHMARHSDPNVDVSCSICSKSVLNLRALQRHKCIVHTDKVYECNFCEKTFKRSISLKEHMASHTGDILYSCPYCPRTFNSSANMCTHKKKSHAKEWAEQKLEKMKQAAVN